MVSEEIRRGWFRGGPCGLSRRRGPFRGCGCVGRASPHFFELVTNLPTVFLQLMPNSGVTFRDLANVASERFGDHAKMTLDLFHLLGVHGALV
jgi:hypothetical protein